MEPFPTSDAKAAPKQHSRAGGKYAEHRGAGDPRYGRSTVTNGSVLLRGVSQNSPWVRRCRDLINLHVEDLGGEENTSVAERSLIRRASVLTTELEQLETKFATANGASADDLDLYSRAASNLRRLLEAVGLKRRSRDVTPSVADYVDHINKQEEATG